MSHSAPTPAPGPERSGPARLLALATSGRWCSVALLHEQGGAVDTDCLAEPFGNEQSQHILGMVRQLLAAAGWRLDDLDAIAFDAGPGAFTGLRIGCAVAQGLGFALDCPVLPIGTLEALAWQRTRDVREPALVLVANDARMGELYAGVFRVQPSGAGALPQIRTLIEAQLVARAGAVADLRAMLEQARQRAAATAGVHEEPLLLAGDAWQALALWSEWQAQSGAEAGLLADAASTAEAACTKETADPKDADNARSAGNASNAADVTPAAVRVDELAPGLRADAVAELAHLRWREGAGVDAAQAVPFYVRDKVALDVGEQQALRAARPAGDTR